MASGSVIDLSPPDASTATILITLTDPFPPEGGDAKITPARDVRPICVLQIVNQSQVGVRGFMDRDRHRAPFSLRFCCYRTPCRMPFSRIAFPLNGDDPVP